MLSWLPCTTTRIVLPVHVRVWMESAESWKGVHDWKSCTATWKTALSNLASPAMTTPHVTWVESPSYSRSRSQFAHPPGSCFLSSNNQNQLQSIDPSLFSSSTPASAVKWSDFSHLFTRKYRVKFQIIGQGTSIPEKRKQKRGCLPSQHPWQRRLRLYMPSYITRDQCNVYPLHSLYSS
jgi:hypothetical protein